MKPIFISLLFLLISACGNTPQVDVRSSPNAASDVGADPLAGVSLKKASDVKQKFGQLGTSAGIDSRAQAIAEVDEWFFVPEDEKQANQLIEEQIGLLRDHIESQISTLSTAAVDAPDGKTAAEKMSQINRALSLYPAPKTVEQRTRLERLTSSILATSRRVEDIRRLRYNSWAISRIEGGLQKYNEIKRVMFTDKRALVDACISYLKEVDPGYLEPAVLDLYNYVLSLTRDAVTPALQIDLAKGLVDPTTKRVTPSAF